MVMPWWTRIPGNTPEIQKHDTQKRAGIAILFATKLGTVKVDQCGLYQRNPATFPDEPNVLLGVIARSVQSERRKAKA